MSDQFPVVALVCSTGGLDALRLILGGLPDDLHAAVIVLQHTRPTAPSKLSEILSRECALPVRVAAPDSVLRPGTVVVVPPGRHALATTENRLVLVASDGAPPYRPSADLLLCSLAVTAGPRTIAVILSGEGHDGATGAVAVHDFGGTVISSDRASTAHFAMPAAAIGRDDAVDHIVPVGEIATLLVSLCDPAAERSA